MRDMEAPLIQRQQLLQNHKHAYHPRTVSRVITRIQALALELLPMQVDLGESTLRATWEQSAEEYRGADSLPTTTEEITSPTSSIITNDVVEAFSKIAGDFDHCLPFALLAARRYFGWQMLINPADSDENEGRKLACEVLARKIVARTPREEQYSILSARFTVIESDGDESLPLSGASHSRSLHPISPFPVTPFPDRPTTDPVRFS